MTDQTNGRQDSEASELPEGFIPIQSDHLYFQTGMSPARKVGLKAMLIGILVAIVGLAATAATYAFVAKAGGGVYFIASGAVVSGATLFFRGLKRLLSGR